MQVVVELSSYRACSRARGGASYTFGALAILVVAPGKNPVVSMFQKPSTAISLPWQQVLAGVRVGAG